MDERELILRAKKDVQAFGELYEKYFQTIFRFVSLRVNNQDIANEVVSETFFKAMAKIGSFRWKSIPFSAWLYRIAINEISNYFRREKKRRKIEDGVVERQSIPKEDADPMEYQFLHEYLKQLPEHDQNLITLYYFDKKNYKEIAEILKEKENTLRVKLHRVREKLGKMIPEEVLENVYARISGTYPFTGDPAGAF